MLTALEKGVKGGKWFSLIDKVYRKDNLAAAFARVKRNDGAAGVDHVTLEMFESRLDDNLDKLSRQLREGSYRPQAVRRVWIDKNGGKEQRPLGIPTVRDRVVQCAVRNVLEPIFEKDFAEHSYGFRPGRGCKDALRRVDHLLKTGYHWAVDADLKSYFDTIDHEILMGLVESKVSDGRMLSLLRSYLQQEVLDTAKRWTPEQGSPQGAVLSPLLSNIYLDGLDHLMSEAGYEMVRYADDFVVLCRSEDEAQAALEVVRNWTDSRKLTLHPEKTCIVDAGEPGGFDFLGYHFERGYRWPSRKSNKKFRDAIRRKTRRNNGYSLDRIIRNVNYTVRGWYNYFQHSHPATFRTQDGWVRMRLRSILRRNQGKRGRGRGSDHQRWPNVFFAERGLFSMTAAYAAACQSCRR
jgi:RNA-directed DNA polymerase